MWRIIEVNRSAALDALKFRIENKNLLKHSLAVEAIMRNLAKYLHEDTDTWGIAGLVHDIDLERIDGDMSRHGLVGAEILEGLNFDETIVYAVKAHNPANLLPRRRKIDKALYCADPMASLILSCTMTLQDKKMTVIDEAFVMKKFYETGFARGANREQIRTCTELDLQLDDFIRISLESLREIKSEW